MLNNTDTLSLKRGFDTFVGFLYSVLIALVIKTAYLNSHFNSIIPISITLFLLVFFAYDWLCRFWGSWNMPETMLEKAGYLYFIKLFLNIAIVYFLLVFSLKFVDIYAPIAEETIPATLTRSYDSLYYSMAIFAILSGAWNALMIRIFKGFNMPHIIALVKGHLDLSIVESFPRLIKKWRVEIQSIIDQKHKEMKELKDNGIFNPSDSNDEYRKKWRKLDRDLGIKLYFKSFLKNPHHLLLPYLFVFHIVVLNFVLGIFIIISTFGGGISLSAQLLSSLGLFLPVWGLALGALLSSVFLTLHFKSSIKMEVSLKERIGCWILFITTIYGYFLCSSDILVFLVILQQIIANIIMTIYFEPPSTVTTKPINEGGSL